METRKHATIFKGLVVDIEQMEVKIGEKGWHVYQIIRHPGGVGVLPLHDDGTVTLIRQLRPAAGGFLLEIPAGRLHPGEDPAACGLREMTEETGLRAGRIDSLGIFRASPGVFDEVIHLYVGTGLLQGEADPEQYEDIETVRLPIGEALKMAAEGGINDGKTIAALFRASARKP
ncbi:MAG TPA: NUDIX hydrolase [Candidatus Deferrimicrobiaceae bacterium]